LKQTITFRSGIDRKVKSKANKKPTELLVKDVHQSRVSYTFYSHYVFLRHL